MELNSLGAINQIITIIPSILAWVLPLWWFITMIVKIGKQI